MSFQAIRWSSPSKNSNSPSSNVVSKSENNNSWFNWKMSVLAASNIITALAVKHIWSSSYIPLVPIVNTVVYFGTPYGIKKAKNGAIMVTNGVKGIVSNVCDGVKSLSTKMQNGVQSGITKVQNGVQSGITKVQNGVQIGVNSLASGIEKITKIDSDILFIAGLSFGVIAIDPTVLTASAVVSNAALILYHKEIGEKLSNLESNVKSLFSSKPESEPKVDVKDSEPTFKVNLLKNSPYLRMANYQYGERLKSSELTNSNIPKGDPKAESAIERLRLMPYGKEYAKVQKKKVMSENEIAYKIASVVTLGLLPLAHKVYDLVRGFFDVSDFFQLDDINIGS